MNGTLEQMQASAKAAMEANLSLAAIQFAAIEKYVQLNADAFKTVFDHSIAYARSLYEAAADADSELLKLSERHLAEAGKELHKARKAA